jgi:hypothetical protein
VDEEKLRQLETEAAHAEDADLAQLVREYRRLRDAMVEMGIALEDE